MSDRNLTHVVDLTRGRNILTSWPQSRVFCYTWSSQLRRRQCWTCWRLCVKVDLTPLVPRYSPYIRHVPQRPFNLCDHEHNHTMPPDLRRHTNTIQQSQLLNTFHYWSLIFRLLNYFWPDVQMKLLGSCLTINFKIQEYFIKGSPHAPNSCYGFYDLKIN